MTTASASGPSSAPSSSRRWPSSAGRPATARTPSTAELRGTLIRALAVLGNDAEAQSRARQLHDRAVADPTSVDPEVAAAAVSVVAATGDRRRLRPLRRGATADAVTPQEQLRYLYALAEFPERRADGAHDRAGLRTRREDPERAVPARPVPSPTATTARWPGGRCGSTGHEANDRFPDNSIVRMVDGGEDADPARGAGRRRRLLRRALRSPRRPSRSSRSWSARGSTWPFASGPRAGSPPTSPEQLVARHIRESGVRVFGVEPTAVQLDWRRLAAGRHELAVGDREQVVQGDGGPGAVVVGRPRAGSHHARGPRRRGGGVGHDPHASDRSGAGPHRHAERPAHRRDRRSVASPGADRPTSSRGATRSCCVGAALEEIRAWAPDLLVLKGDLSDNDDPAEYAYLAAHARRVPGARRDDPRQPRRWQPPPRRRTDRSAGR